MFRREKETLAQRLEEIRSELERKRHEVENKEKERIELKSQCNEFMLWLKERVSLYVSASCFHADF